MNYSVISQGWRWCGTAFSFFIFGLGGVLIPVFVVPILYIIPGGKARREQRAQKVIHYAFRYYIEVMRGLGVLSYQVTNIQKLQGAKLILANHPSLIDVIFLIALVPNANCVVKNKLTRNFFTRGPIKAAGYIANNDPEEVIKAAKDAFDKGHALILFPEGTRSTPLQPLQLKRGAANVAIRAQADITPVVISCHPTTLTKSDRWYQVPAKKVHFQIHVKDITKIDPYIKSSTIPSKQARLLTGDLETYFNQECVQHEQSSP
jgi:1-acyl-sn-glycerol-3-phosphate acyltransferase